MAAVLCACGARSGLDEPPTPDVDAGVVAAPPAVTPPDPMVCPDLPLAPFESCGPMRFRLGTEASCALVRTSCEQPVDAEAWQPVTCPWSACDPATDPRCDWPSPCDRDDPPRYRVLGLNRWGEGHVLAYCDSTVLAALLERDGILRYLSPAAAPRIASVGAGYPCAPDERDPRRLTIATYLGAVLPGTYLDEPARLAADWDVLVACPRRMPVEDIAALEPVIDRFVRVDGGGLVVTDDYVNPSWLDPIPRAHIDVVSRLIEPAGFRFLPITLPHSNYEVDLPCVPDL